MLIDFKWIRKSTRVAISSDGFLNINQSMSIYIYGKHDSSNIIFVGLPVKN